MAAAASFSVARCQAEEVTGRRAFQRPPPEPCFLLCRPRDHGAVAKAARAAAAKGNRRSKALEVHCQLEVLLGIVQEDFGA